MKTVYGYTCDSCEREVSRIYLGNHGEDLCDDCYQRQTGMPVFERSQPFPELYLLEGKLYFSKGD